MLLHVFAVFVSLSMALNRLLGLGINGLLIIFYILVLFAAKVIIPYLFCATVQMLHIFLLYVDDIVRTASSEKVKGDIIALLILSPNSLCLT